MVCHVVIPGQMAAIFMSNIIGPYVLYCKNGLSVCFNLCEIRIIYLYINI